ncbi:ankyrin repeat domain-containing protein 26 [Gorilla gorilla gorilla]|uniref:ankyrin repeat domain-containing protein 26 n=1 Tax=Gorilla gorilla gorilla TaxID=9595 RepID=UPI0030087A45
MKKTSGFRRRKGGLPWGSVSSPGKVGAGAGSESADHASSQPRRHDPDKGLDRLRRAAGGDRTETMRRILSLRKSGVDDRDKKNRLSCGQSSGDSWLSVDDEPFDSDAKTTFENVPQKYDSHLTGADGQRGKRTIKEQEDSLEQYHHLKPKVEIKECVSNQVVGMKDVQACTSEQDLEVTSEQEPERLEGSENNKPQAEGDRKKHARNETEASRNLHDISTDDRIDNGLIQQGENGKTDGQQIPRTEQEECDSVPALHMKEVKKNEHEDWTTTESVTSLVFKKADLITLDLLQVTDESSLTEIDEEERRLTKKTSNEKDKVRNQIHSVDGFDDLTWSSEIASECCELPYSNYKKFILLIEELGVDCKDPVNLLKIQDAVHSWERSIEVEKNHCELLTVKMKKMENEVHVLQKELSETIEIKLQLEHQNDEWERDFYSLRSTLRQEEEKRKNANALYEKIRGHLRRKEEQYRKEVEANKQLQLTLRTRDTELRTVRNHLNQVVQELNDTQRQLSREQNARILQDEILTNHLCKQKEIALARRKRNSQIPHSHDKVQDLLHENRMLQDEIATLRLEIDTIEKQNQENKKKYFEDIGDLQKTIKRNGEIVTTMISEYTAQLGVLTAENTMLHSQLEREKQKKESLETEVESHRCRLAAVRRDCEQSETSKRDVELAFQGAKDEWFHLPEKMNFDVSDLKANSVLRSQQLSRTQSNLESLSLKFQHTRDALTEKQKRGLFQNAREETYAKPSVKSRKFNKCIKVNNVTEGIHWKAGICRGEAVSTAE